MLSGPLRNDTAERALLGAVLVDPAVLPTAGDLRTVDFAVRSHRQVWESMLRLDQDATPIDLVSVTRDLEHRGELQAIGGPGFLASLIDGVPRAVSIEAWSGFVRDAARLRTALNAAERMASLAKGGSSAHDVLSKGLELLTRAMEETGATVDLNVAGAIREAALDLQDSSRGQATGWKTGLADLDRHVGRLLPGQLWIVGGRTGQGKSTLVANIGDAIAAQGGKAFLFSAEMSRREINRRRLLAEARVPASHFEADGITPTTRDFDALTRAAETLQARPFVIDASAPTPAELRVKARYVKAAMGLDVVLVDYLQLMPPGPGRKGENREQEVARVSRGLKRLAMDLGVTVIAAAQLNRALEARKDPRPRLSDLRESGSQEQDADVVLLVHRDEGEDNQAELLVAKHRNRGQSRVRVRFEGGIHRFDNLAGGS